METVVDGVLVPQPILKSMIETTAKAVFKSKDRSQLVQKILAGNPVKFSFLKTNDPHHAFYRKVLAENDAQNKVEQKPEVAAAPTEEKKEANGDADTAKGAVVSSAAEAAPAVETTEKAAEISKSKAADAKAKAARQTPTEPPPPEVFTLQLPAPLPTALELEIIRLTAQFAACCGRPFLAGVNAREYRKPEFGFLKPEHPYFQLFQAFTSMYEQVSKPPEDLSKRIEKLSERKTAIFGEVQYRVDWEQLQERAASKDADNERVQMQLIDWHDFVLVETIELNEEDENLPEPVKAPEPVLLTNPKGPSKAETGANGTAAVDQEDEDMEMEIDEGEDTTNVAVADANADIPANLVRRDYVPKVAPATRPAQDLNVVLPSGQTVPVSEASKSIKVELMDPKYKEERSRAADKNRLQNLATDDEIARNLGRLNDARPEVFGRVDLQEALHAKQIDRPIQGTGSTLPNARAPKPVDAPAPAPPVAPQPKEAPTYVMPYANANAADAPAPPPEKRPRIEDGDGDGTKNLVPEDEWLASHSDTVRVHVKTPLHSNKEWELKGKTISMEVPLKAAVGALKVKITELTKLPSNKQKLQVEKIGFLKDSQTLASYNLEKDTILVLEVKERGGKKK